MLEKEQRAKLLRGVIADLVTPYHGSGVNATRVRDLVRFLISRGVHGLLVGGTAGEGPLLSLEERLLLAEVATDEAAGRVPVVVQVGASDTAATLFQARHAAGCRAAAVAATPPAYYRLDRRALSEYFAEIAASVPDLPVYLVHLPTTGNDLSVDLAREIYETVRNVAGIIDASGELERYQAFRRGLTTSATVLISAETLLVPATVVGCDGVLSAIANVYPEPLVDLVDVLARAQWDEARRLHHQITVIRDILAQGHFLAAVKQALTWRGLDVGSVRPPLRRLGIEEERRLHAMLDEMALLPVRHPSDARPRKTR